MARGLIVGLDARLYQGDHTGIGIYSRGLINALAEINGEDRYLLFSDRELAPPSPRCRLRKIPCRKRFIWTQFLLPLAAAGTAMDLFHALANHELPLLWTVPSVVTVHDLIPILYPETTTPRHRMNFRLFIGGAIRRARAVITDSEFVRRSILERFSIDEQKVFSIPLAHDPAFGTRIPPEEIERVRSSLGLRPPYVLYLGAFEPRKNLPALIEAFSSLAGRPALKEWRLVLAGGGGWYQERVHKAAASSGLGDRLAVRSFITAGDLPALYQGAEVFVLPSLYEGFGLPALEAMASGRPVLVSRPSALEELVGDAGETFDLNRPGDLTARLETLMGDESRRAALGALAAARARLFSWRRCADETMAVYLNVLGRKPWPKRGTAATPAARAI